MIPLRQKMTNDMKLRRFSPETIQLYVYAVKDIFCDHIEGFFFWPSCGIRSS